MTLALERRKERGLRTRSQFWSGSLREIEIERLGHTRMIIAGDICIAKQQMRDKWYRAIVNKENITDNDCKTYNIFYVDYGCSENNVPASRMRDIDERYRTLPAQVMCCSLYGLIPKKKQWSCESTNDFIKLVSET